jgi:hypothetical protein
MRKIPAHRRPPPVVKVELPETKGEFRRATDSRPVLGNTANFGVAPTADDDDDDFTTTTHPTVSPCHCGIITFRL